MKTNIHFSVRAVERMDLKIRNWRQVATSRPARPTNSDTELTFINIVTPGEIRDRHNQHIIRSHVMRDIAISRRRGALLDLSSESVGSRPAAGLQQVNVCSYLQRIFRALVLSDKAALSLVLVDTGCHASQVFGSFIGGTAQQPVDALRKYTKLIGLIRGQLLQRGGISAYDAVIGTIICLAFYDMRRLESDRWTMHLDGLRVIMDTSDGIGRLNVSRHLSQALSLVDVIGSLVFDRRPRFSRPKVTSLEDSEISASSRHLNGVLCSWQRRYPAMYDLMRILGQLAQLAEYINQAPLSIKQGSTYLFQALAVLVYDLLAMSQPLTHHTSALLATGTKGSIAVREAVRLTALIYVTTVLTKSSGDELYCPKKYQGAIRRVVSATNGSDWAGLEQLKLWVLVIAALSSDGGNRHWMIDRISPLMSTYGWVSWDELLIQLRYIAWNDALATEEQQALKTQVNERFGATLSSE